MTEINTTELLRANLLENTSIVLARASGAAEAFSVAVHRSCEELGARMAECLLSGEPEPAAQEEAVGEAVDAALDELGGAEVLVVDAASLFSAAEGSKALSSTLQGAWSAVRALANAAFLPESRGGRVFLLAPPPDAGEMADGTRAGLENLARTLSIEWARYGVTIVTVALGSKTDPREVGTLVAYLASPAGAYFSGCMLDLRGPARH